jgi:hypothetical protein
VHEKGGRGREVHCAPFPNMCRLSWGDQADR